MKMRNDRKMGFQKVNKNELQNTKTQKSIVNRGEQEIGLQGDNVQSTQSKDIEEQQHLLSNQSNQGSTQIQGENELQNTKTQKSTVYPGQQQTGLQGDNVQNAQSNDIEEQQNLLSNQSNQGSKQNQGEGGLQNTKTQKSTVDRGQQQTGLQGDNQNQQNQIALNEAVKEYYLELFNEKIKNFNAQQGSLLEQLQSTKLNHLNETNTIQKEKETKMSNLKGRLSELRGVLSQQKREKDEEISQLKTENNAYISQLKEEISKSLRGNNEKDDEISRLKGQMSLLKTEKDEELEEKDKEIKEKDDEISQLKDEMNRLQLKLVESEGIIHQFKLSESSLKFKRDFEDLLTGDIQKSQTYEQAKNSQIQKIVSNQN